MSETPTWMLRAAANCLFAQKRWQEAADAATLEAIIPQLCPEPLLSIAHSHYIAGEIEVDEFERSLDRILT